MTSAASTSFIDRLLRVVGVLPPGAATPVTVDDYAQIYKEPPSFIQYLSFKGYDPADEVFLLQDGINVGAILELTPIDVEGQSAEALSQIESGIQAALQRIPSHRDYPFIVQTYLSDEPITDLVDKLREYSTDAAKATKHHEIWMAEMQEHMQQLAKEGGFFRDDLAQFHWNGQYRKVRCVVYRKCDRSVFLTNAGKPVPGQASPAVDLNDALSSFVSALGQIGIRARRYDSEDLYKWLLPWFSPRPDSFDSSQELLKQRPFPDDSSCVGVGADLSEMLFNGLPESDEELAVWRFNGMPCRLISLQAIDTPPGTGVLTAETKSHAGSTASMWDQLPKGSVFVTTIVVASQGQIETHCNNIIDASGQGSRHAVHAADQAQAALNNISLEHHLYPTFSGLYLRGENDVDLATKSRKAITILASSRFNPIEPRYDPTALDAYVRHLPMSFDYALDQRQGRSTRLTYTNHLACYLPFYGRGRGTGNPGNVFFNRVGEPMLFDPSRDKTRVAHGLIFGPTGAGKSATINYLCMHEMAVRKPRLFIIEKGNSFGLMGRYFKDTGLTTNIMTFTPTSDISLPPYAKAFAALEQAEENEATMRAALSMSVDAKLDDNDDNDYEEQRDYLGEMELLTRLMITGADPKKQDDIEQPDKLLLRKAILAATRAARDHGIEYVIPSNVVSVLKGYAAEPGLTEKRREKILHLAESLEFWTQGMHGKFFNRPGVQWPEVDVTILDMGILTSEQYSDMLTVTIVTLINTITDIGEKHQYEDRETHVYTDEGHVITTNPTLVKPFVFGAKTWRKLNIWLRQGTQQLKDYPAEAEKMLDLSEWWYLIGTSENEVVELERFKSLTPAEKLLMSSTRKEHHKYTEGVILSPTLNSIFRVVLPALPLVLAGTDGDEKIRRQRVMTERGMSELEASFYLVDELKKARML